MIIKQFLDYISFKYEQLINNLITHLKIFNIFFFSKFGF